MFRISALFLFVLALTACGPSEVEIAATQTAIVVTSDAQRTATQAAMPTATLTPTATPAPTETPTPTPIPGIGVTAQQVRDLLTGYGVVFGAWQDGIQEGETPDGGLSAAIFGSDNQVDRVFIGTITALTDAQEVIDRNQEAPHALLALVFPAWQEADDWYTEQLVSAELQARDEHDGIALDVSALVNDGSLLIAFGIGAVP